jgi:hypothetical protein
MRSMARMLEHLLGKANTVPIPVAIAKILDGDYACAAALGQVVYWTHVAREMGRPDGWFAKTYEGWYRELGIGERTMRRHIRKLESIEPQLIQTRTKKFEGKPVLHFRANTENIAEWLTLNLPVQSGQNGRNDPDKMSETIEPDKMAGTIYREEITDRDSPTGEQPAEKPVDSPKGEAPKADSYVAKLYDDLEGARPPIAHSRRSRYGSQFKEQILAGVDEATLWKAEERLVEAWKGTPHKKLTVEQAVEDVVAKFKSERTDLPSEKREHISEREAPVRREIEQTTAANADPNEIERRAARLADNYFEMLENFGRVEANDDYEASVDMMRRAPWMHESFISAIQDRTDTLITEGKGTENAR